MLVALPGDTSKRGLVIPRQHGLASGIRLPPDGGYGGLRHSVGDGIAESGTSRGVTMVSN